MKFRYEYDEQNDWIDFETELCGISIPFKIFEQAYLNAKKTRKKKEDSKNE